MRAYLTFVAAVATAMLWSAEATAQTRAEARLLREAKELTLGELKANPAGFLGQYIVFDAFYAQMGDVYRPFYTPFQRDFFVNFWVWSPSARLWEPKEREEAFFFCYVERENAKTLDVIQNLKRFDAIRVLAKLETVSEGHAWLKVLTVMPTDKPTYSDKAIKHIELGMRQLQRAEFPLAAKFFEIALQERLPEEARKLVYREAGVTFYELKEYGKAEQYLKEALKLVTANDPLLNLRLGQSLLHVAEILTEPAQVTEKLQTAAQQLEQAISLEPNLADAHAAVGLVYGLLGDHNKGLNACRVALKLSPQHAQAFRNVAVIYHLKKDMENAVLYFQKAILAKANEPLYHRELADIYMELGRYADAEMEYKNFITLDPENPEAYWLRAQARLAQNNVDGAIEDNQTALEKQADFQRAYATLAKAYMQKKNFAAAQETLQRGTAIFASDVAMWVLLGDVLKKQDKYDEAASVLERVVALQPADNQARYEWAKTLAEKPKPDYAKAIQELETTVRNDPDMLESRFLLGHLYIDTSNPATLNPSKAMTHLIPYLKKNPKDANALIFQGIALTQLGQYQKAVASYDEALAIDGTNPYASSNKAAVLCLMGRDAEMAVHLAEMAVAAMPENAQFLGTLAWAKAASGDYAGARSAADKALSKEESAEAYYYLALADYGLGDIDSAAADMAKCQALLKTRRDTTADFRQLAAKVGKLDSEIKKAQRARQAEARRSEQRRGKTAAAPAGAATEELAPVPVVTP